MYRSTRRGFMMGCSAAIANLASARFTNLVFADPLALPSHDTLIVLFLRGGMDGLSFVLPTGGPDRAFYETQRRKITFHCIRCDHLYTEKAGTDTAPCPKCGHPNTRLKF